MTLPRSLLTCQPVWGYRTHVGDGKTCKECVQYKPLDEFYLNGCKRSDGMLGRYARCKVCMSATINARQKAKRRGLRVVR